MNDWSPECPICGGSEFSAGPGGRMSTTGLPPRCVACGSLERHRSFRRLMLTIPRAMLGWRRALQFAPDRSIDPTWFASFEESQYGGTNSIDLQEIARADDRYDFISLSHVLEFVPDDRRAFAELARVGSDCCIIHITFASQFTAPISTHWPEPHGSYGRFHDYGRDVCEWLEVPQHGFVALKT